MRSWVTPITILTVFVNVLYTCQPVWAKNRCASLFVSKIPATIGVEVEWQPIRANIERKNVDPLVEGMSFPFSREESDFNRMELGKMFGLYGRDEKTGKFKENLLPKKVTASVEFKRLLNPEPVPFPEFANQHPREWIPDEHRQYREYSRKLSEARLPFSVQFDGEYYYITNFGSLKGPDLIRTLQLLFDIAGAESADLILAKRPEAWVSKNSASDVLIPSRVVIEERNGRSAGLEFPMAGAVRTEQEVRDYIKNLWIRLGLFEEQETELIEEATSNTNIHMHWVPQIQSMPKEKRKLLYRAQKDLFGDLNDEAMLSDYTELALQLETSKLSSDTSETKLLTAFYQLVASFMQMPIQNLTRSAFRRIEVTSEGIYEKDRLRTENDMDPNFSDELKLLRYGLRGKYGQESLPTNQPVPKVGIEFRNDGTFVKTMRHVSESEERFVDSVPTGTRGIEDDPAQLRILAQHYGIDTRLIGLAYESLHSGNSHIKQSQWRPSTIIATLLLPLTAWESHPLYQRGLKQLSREQSSKMEKSFATARARYKQNINRLVSLAYGDASSNDNFPDWLRNGIKQPLFSSEGSKYLGQLDGVKVNQQGELFQIILFGEAMRFLRDSGVASVMTGH